ncbi:MAG: DnaJ domain-containing protein [Chloroflexi bacterium]|nr:DnaJ domain-containing protein [Chloroflexota bacterium]
MAAAAEDLYEVLQISPNAEAAVVEGAYKRLAAKYHPDVYKGADGHQRMVALNSAYQVLRDPERRAQYDAARKVALGATRSGSATGSQGGSSRRGLLNGMGWLSSVAVFCLIGGLSTFAYHPARSLPLLLVGAGLVAWIFLRLSRAS